MDQRKLGAMVEYCQTTKCRTRYILDYFGQEMDAGWRCHSCDACDTLDAWDERPPK